VTVPSDDADVTVPSDDVTVPSDDVTVPSDDVTVPSDDQHVIRTSITFSYHLLMSPFHLGRNLE
jgi:hypothetical protein